MVAPLFNKEATISIPWPPMGPHKGPQKKQVFFLWALKGGHEAPWGPIGNPGGLLVASLLNNGATMKLPWGPGGLQEGLMPTPPAATKKSILMGLGGPEVKFGQIAPSLGDRKLHVLGWFWHRSGPILAG